MSPLDLSKLSGPDAVAALRSYPRRYRSAVLPVNDPDVEELAYRIGPSGHSALDLVVHATHTFALLGEALRQVLEADDPVLHPGVTDAGQRVWEPPPGATITDTLDRFAEQTERLAAVVDGVHPPDTRRTGRVAGGGEISALDVAKEAVRAGAEDLDLIKTTLDALS